VALASAVTTTHAFRQSFSSDVQIFWSSESDLPTTHAHKTAEPRKFTKRSGTCSPTPQNAPATDYEVPLDKGAKPDTSATELYVKMALAEKDNVQKAIADLSAFIKKARISGRTEVEPAGDVGLSLVTPEKYRYDIIAKITQDAKRLQAAVGSQCKVEISGLSNRVSWQRSDISELTLYIPYQVQLTACQ
jgi:hypothetical protein